MSVKNAASRGARGKKGASSTHRSARRNQTAGASASRSRPAGRARSGAPETLSVTSSHRAAVSADERTGSAFRAVGHGLGAAFGFTARGVGSLTRGLGSGIASAARRGDSYDDYDEVDEFDDNFEAEESDLSLIHI